MWPTYFQSQFHRGEATPPETDCWVTIFKHSDTTRSTGSIYSADPDLHFETDAGGLYHIVGQLYWYIDIGGASGGAAPLMRFAHLLPAAGLVYRVKAALFSSTNPVAADSGNADGTVALDQLGSKGFSGTGAANTGVNYAGHFVDIILLVDAASTFQLEWAKNSTPGNMTLRELSYLQVRKLN